MLNVQARRQLLFSKAGGRRSFRQLERLVMLQLVHLSKISFFVSINDPACNR
jgi:hypothetical protein